MSVQQSKINKQIMAITDQRELLTGQLNSIINSNTEWYKDSNVKILEAQDDQLDMQLGQLETQLKAIESNMEAFEKQKEENIKSGVPSLAS